jgi:hypothetical protein
MFSAFFVYDVVWSGHTVTVTGLRELLNRIMSVSCQNVAEVRLRTTITMVMM